MSYSEYISRVYGLSLMGRVGVKGGRDGWGVGGDGVEGMVGCRGGWCGRDGWGVGGDGVEGMVGV